MRKLERILWMVIGIGVLLKVLHLPPAGFLLILGFSLLSMLYFLLGAFLFPTPTRQNQIMVLSIFSGIVLSILVLGMLFKIQIWPMAGFYLILAIPATFGLCIVFLLVKRSKPQLAEYARRMLVRLLISGTLALALYALPTRAILNYHYADNPLKAALLDSLRHTSDRQVQEELIHRLDSLDRARHEPITERSPSAQ